jgi:tRNA(fMet)-specific endonuclease VapC
MKSGAIKRQFLAFYDTLELPILAYDRVAAEFHASERVRLRSSKYADGQIAAIAVTRGLTLVTANTSDFKAFRDLRLEDWSR